MNSNDRTLRVNDVADILQVSPMTVIRWCNQGDLYYIKIGASRRFRREDIDDFIDSKQKKKQKPQRQVYDGPPADQCGFDSDADDIYRQIELEKQCRELGRLIAEKNSKKTNEANVINTPTIPNPFKNYPQSQRKYPSGFDKE